MTLTSDIDFLIEKIDNIVDERLYIIPTEYIESVRYLPKGLSPKPGFFEFDYTPYLIEIFNHSSPESLVEEIVVMKSAQIGYTVGILENLVLYYIGCNPKQMQFVTADNALAEETVKTRIDPMIDHAGLRDKIFAQSKRKGSRATGDTTLLKEYPGGFVKFGGAKNPDSFRGRTYQVTAEDEIDTYQDIKKEGSILSLIKNRSNAFSLTRKIFYGSTPLIKQTSKIYELYMQGDQRNYFIPCPICGEMQVLKWHGVNKDGQKYGIVFDITPDGLPDYDTVGYKCPHCQGVFKDYDKAKFLRKEVAEWRPTATPKKPRLKSYWINALYSPPGMYPWERLVEDWADCWDLKLDKIKDIEKYREFRNTKQGLPFEEKGESISYDKAVIHRRQYAKGEIDNLQAIRDTGSPILFLLCSVDDQKNNLFVDVKGYTSGGRTYTIDFFSLDGVTEDRNSKSWKELDKLLTDKIYLANDGKKYKIIATFIDSGKYTTYVYDFCSKFSLGVYPIKGERSLPGNVNIKMLSKEVLTKARCNAGYRINITTFKDAIAYRMQRLEWATDKHQPEWYPNFPENLRDDYFKQFEAESKIDVKDPRTGKYLYSYWKQVGQRDNHAFDTYVYNLACLDMLVEVICLQELQLEISSYSEFWKYAETGIFYTE